jgi:hypothetical protein
MVFRQSARGRAIILMASPDRRMTRTGRYRCVVSARSNIMHIGMTAGRITTPADRDSDRTQHSQEALCNHWTTKFQTSHWERRQDHTGQAWQSGETGVRIRHDREHQLDEDIVE